jgi:hypothetical protein
MKNSNRFYLVLALSIALGISACSGLSSSGVQDGINTAASILDVLATVLKPAVETSAALCDELTKETSLVREQARFECAGITDAWNNVASLETELQEAMKTGNDAEIAKATSRLSRGANELATVLSKSMFARKQP